MKTFPDWELPRMALFQVIIAVSVGLVTGLFELSVGKMLTHALFFTISYFFVSALMTGFFYFVIKFLHDRTLVPLKLYSIVVMAQIPAVVLKVLSPLDIPIHLVGILITCVLLAVGFVERERLPRTGVLRLMSVIFGVFFLIWMVSVITSSNETESSKVEIPEETIDQIRREMGK